MARYGEMQSKENSEETRKIAWYVLLHPFIIRQSISSVDQFGHVIQPAQCAPTYEDRYCDDDVDEKMIRIMMMNHNDRVMTTTTTTMVTKTTLMMTTIITDFDTTTTTTTTMVTMMTTTIDVF